MTSKSQLKRIAVQSEMKTPIEKAIDNGANFAYNDGISNIPKGAICFETEAQLKATIDDYNAQFSEPAGWKLVPIEPTVEMMDEAFDNITLSDAHSPYGVAEHVWAYMLEKAPSIAHQPLPPEWAEYVEMKKLQARNAELVEVIFYLHNAFENEVFNCIRCGHAEETKDMDSAGYLRDAIERLALKDK